MGRLSHGRLAEVLIVPFLHVLPPAATRRPGVHSLFRGRIFLLQKHAALIIITGTRLSLVFRAHLQAYLSGVESLLTKIGGFFFYQEVLLWTENRTWSGNSDPTDEGGSRNLEMLHCIAANKSSRSA